MTQIGSDNIPVSGSKAAIKRKERLEYQVPAHDLDASLCHNLTENEAAQLTQYVEKIKEHSVGQGVVVRLGQSQKGQVGFIESNVIYANADKPIPERIVKDKILSAILLSKPIQSLLHEPAKVIDGSKLNLSKQPMYADFEGSKFLSVHNKNKLRDFGINTDAIESYVTNEPIYEQIFNGIKRKRVRFEDDCLLGPIAKFREEYAENELFKNDMNDFVENLHLDGQQTSPSAGYDEAVRKDHNSDIFNSPLALEPIFPLRQGALMHQDTPVRRINFDARPAELLKLPPAVSAVKRDKVLSKILNSEQIKAAVYYPTSFEPNTVLTLSRVPMKPDFAAGNSSNHLRESDKRFLENLGLNTEAVHSNIVNGKIYDKLFQDLDDCDIDYSDCCLLQPMKELRHHYKMTKDPLFVSNLNNLVAAEERENPLYGMPFPSKSTDSGFSSTPPTPNYATHPILGCTNAPKQTPVSNNFNLISLLDALELDGLPSPPPVPFSNSKQQITNHPSQESFQFAEEQVTPLEAVTKCKACKQDIYAGTVAVKAARAGKEDAWHPKCFTCYTCGELLADLVYFFHGGHIYCGRDLAEILKIPRCKACDELIFTKEYTAAEGATFHIKHFCCYQCDTPLAGQQYIPDDKTNHPLCLKCYDEYYAEKCQYCLRIIGPTEEGVNFERLHWHKNCFICAGLQCGKTLIGGKFCIKNNLPFCSPKCVATIRTNY